MGIIDNCFGLPGFLGWHVGESAPDGLGLLSLFRGSCWLCIDGTIWKGGFFNDSSGWGFFKMSKGAPLI